jgi:hypothetical protein
MKIRKAMNRFAGLVNPPVEGSNIAAVMQTQQEK